MAKHLAFGGTHPLGAEAPDVTRKDVRTIFDLSARLTLVALTAALPGCFTVEGTLAADGSARFSLTYYIARHVTVSAETRRLSSEHVTVASLRGLGARRAAAEIRVDDVRNLATAEAFRNVEVTRAREGDEEHLHLILHNPFAAAQREALARQARENPDLAGPRIVLTLPARVVGANRGAAVEESRVTWTMTLVEYALADTLDFDVRYAAPGTRHASDPDGEPAVASP